MNAVWSIIVRMGYSKTIYGFASWDKAKKTGTAVNTAHTVVRCTLSLKHTSPSRTSLVTSQLSFAWTRASSSWARATCCRCTQVDVFTCHTNITKFSSYNTSQPECFYHSGVPSKALTTSKKPDMFSQLAVWHRNWGK